MRYAIHPSTSASLLLSPLSMNVDWHRKPIIHANIFHQDMASLHYPHLHQTGTGSKTVRDAMFSQRDLNWGDNEAVGTYLTTGMLCSEFYWEYRHLQVRARARRSQQNFELSMRTVRQDQSIDCDATFMTILSIRVGCHYHNSIYPSLRTRWLMETRLPQHTFTRTW